MTESRAELTQERASRRRQAFFIFKLMLFGGLVYWAQQRGLLWESARALGRIAPLDAFGALLALGATLALGVIRWRWVLRSFGLVEPSFFLGLRLYYEGLFYNTFTPGAVGGDVLRAHWLRAHDEGDSKLHYLVTLGERGLGLVTLGALGAYVLLGVGGGVAYVSVGALMLLALPRLHEQLRALKPLWLIAAAFLNLVSHLVSFLIYLSLARSLGITLSGDVWLSALTLTVLAANLPISIGGFGPREVTLITLLGAHNVAESTATALSLGAFAALATHALLGGIAHLITPVKT